MDHVLMPLRVVYDESEPENRGKRIKYVRYHSGANENRGVINAQMIDWHPPVLVTGVSLSDIEEKLLEKLPAHPDTVNGFVLSDEFITFPVDDQGGRSRVIVKSANFCRLVDVDQAELNAEYKLDAHLQEKGHSTLLAYSD